MASRNVETYKTAHQAFNRRDFDAVVNMMTEDATYEDRARGVTFRGRAGFREFMQGWVTALSNAEVTDPVYIDAGDTVVTQFVGRGVNDGPLGPLPATGKPVTFHLCEFFRFNSQGQITSGGIYYDQLSILTQLGHAQAPQKATAA
ncbi:MAG: ester cyclase [Bryobacteraceae bacterium]|nr:ester cyclase [Bryobacteraceae bacterium]